jgi:hypothetical protein
MLLLSQYKQLIFTVPILSPSIILILLTVHRDSGLSNTFFFFKTMLGKRLVQVRCTAIARNLFHVYSIICLSNLFTSMYPMRTASMVSMVRFPALPDFLRSSGSGTGSTQPCQYN